MYMANYYEEKVLNAFRNVTATAPAGIYASLLKVLPTGNLQGEEVAYPNYKRIKVQFTEPAEDSATFGADSIGIKNIGDISWEKITGGSQGTAVGVGFYDALNGGNLWAYVEIPENLTLDDQEKPTIYNGDCQLTMGGNVTKYFATKVLNLLRGITLDGFNVHIGLSNGDMQKGGLELTGTNYARKEIKLGSPEQQSNNQALCKNINKITFNVPNTNWGLWTHNAYFETAISPQPILTTQLKSETGQVIQKQLKIGYTPEFEIGAIVLGAN